MSLSPEQRAALRHRTEELRTEVSSLTAERDAALTDQSQAIDDAKLLGEVLRLEQERDAAAAQRDAVVGTTTDAMAVMQAAIDAEDQAHPQQVIEIPTVEVVPDEKVEPEPEPVPVDAPVEVPAEAPASPSTVAKQKNGGNR